MKRILLIVAIMILLIASVSCGKTRDEAPPEPRYSSLSEIELDELQRLYIDFDPSFSFSEALEYVEASGLPYSSVKYNGSRTIQVALTDGATAQKYKKVAGDYVTISYAYPKRENSINDDLEKYSFDSCSYYPESARFSLIQSVDGCHILKLGSDLKLDLSMTKEDQMLYYFNEK